METQTEPATYRTSSILVMMFSAYERSRSRATRSRTLSWSNLFSSPSATVRPILRFCLQAHSTQPSLAWHSFLNCQSFKHNTQLWTSAGPRNSFKLPEIFEVLLDVSEQRVLKRLNVLSVYFLRDQLRSPPFCGAQTQAC